ncbi:MAG TPA: hypothetical protein VHD91_10835 [Gaiellaceae bacterium]|nr:hypothetical protein [Gaiellaceae bacterium]
MIRNARSRIAIVAAAATMVVGMPAASAASGTGISNWVTLDGVGGVVPGMTAGRVHVLWGIPVPTARKACATTKIHVTQGNLNGYALFLHGRFGAVFFTSGAVTPSGVRVGSSLGALTAAYGKQLRTVPGSGTYFLRRKASPRYELRFDVAKKTVRLIGFGDEAVHFVGGCGY